MQHLMRNAALAVSLASMAACAKSAPPAPLVTLNMPAVGGQQKACDGPRQKTYNLDVVEATVDLGMGTTFAAWTYGGRLPGPTIEACQGDTVTLNVRNAGSVSHGLDTHAMRIDARHFGPVGPGKTLTITRTVDTPGVFMYHCAAGPVTDLHIKSGLHGAMIVYPRNDTLRPAREIVIVQDAVYGTRDASGHIAGTDPATAKKNDPAIALFNGRMDNQAVRVAPGDLVRIYFVNVGPGTSATHVIGSVLDRVSSGETWVTGVQTYGVPAGAGAMLEFRVPDSGVFPFVDHDKLAFLPYGLAIAFATEGVDGRAH